MKKSRIILAVLLILFAGIQFLPSGLPGNKPEGQNSLAQSSLVKDSVLALLRTSCFDCHSDQTVYPWYSKIAPASWLLSDHIREGRSQLNFSEWETYGNRKKLSHMDEIAEQVKSRKMPLKSYLLLHRKAKLSEVDISTLLEWTEKAASEILD